jgi:hypothetical protein
MVCLQGMSWVRFQVLTAASMKLAVFRLVAPCSVVDVYWRFQCQQSTRQPSSRNFLFFWFFWQTAWLTSWWQVVKDLMVKDCKDRIQIELTQDHVQWWTLTLAVWTFGIFYLIAIWLGSGLVSKYEGSNNFFLLFVTYSVLYFVVRVKIRIT